MQQSTTPAPSAALGFVGTGEITAAIVTGLSADVADPPAIFVSPRGREVARALAERFANVRVCSSNQEVLERADSIVLAVRPPMVHAVLADLSFRPEHVLISAAAGVPLDQLRQWCAPAGDVVRVIPLPQSALRQSVTAMYPDQPIARDLFARLGDVVAADDERILDAFSAATATVAAHLDYVATIASWLTDQGVSDDAATAYLRNIFGQLGRSLTESTDSLATLTTRHMTPGGINEQFLSDLRSNDIPDTVHTALDRVLSRLRG